MRSYLRANAPLLPLNLALLTYGLMARTNPLAVALNALPKGH